MGYILRNYGNKQESQSFIRFCEVYGWNTCSCYSCFRKIYNFCDVSISLSEVHAIRYRSPHNPLKKSSIFIFCNRTKTTIKVLEWDGNGFWLHTKKLIGKDRFRWPKSKEEASMLIDKRQLSWLLDGLEIEQKHAHHKIDAVI